MRQQGRLTPSCLLMGAKWVAEKRARKRGAGKIADGERRQRSK